MEDLISINEVSNKLKVKESTLRAWVFQRKIPCVRVGRLVRFRLSEIERWLTQENRKQGGNRN